jgi:peptide/nickel transport system substrate-binding protein
MASAIMPTGFTVGWPRRDAGRPMIFYASSASCWQPAVKGLTLMVNTVFSSYRFEDIWLDR